MLLNNLQITVPDILFLCKPSTVSPFLEELGHTCGAWIKFISRRRVWRWPSAGRLFFRASNKKDVHCCRRLCSMNTSTICWYWSKLEKRGVYTLMYIFLCIQKAWLDRSPWMMLWYYPPSYALCQDPNLSQTEITGYPSTYYAAFSCFRNIIIMLLERQVSHVSFIFRIEEVHYSELLCQTLPPTLI